MYDYFKIYNFLCNFLKIPTIIYNQDRNINQFIVT